MSRLGFVAEYAVVETRAYEREAESVRRDGDSRKRSGKKEKKGGFLWSEWCGLRGRVCRAKCEDERERDRE